MIEIPDEVVNNLQVRLRRVSGQVLGVERMLDEGRECKDIINQLAAARKALDQVGFKLLAAGLKSCLKDEDNPERASADFSELEKMFGRLA